MKINFKTDVCANCGASSGLHHFETLQCPKNGMEEICLTKPQQWQNTFFEDSGVRKLHDAAPDLFGALQDIIHYFDEAKSFVLPIDLSDSINILGRLALKKATE